MTLSALLLCAAETGEPLKPEQWEPMIRLAALHEGFVSVVRQTVETSRPTVGGKPGFVLAAPLTNALQHIDSQGGKS